MKPQLHFLTFIFVINTRFCTYLEGELKTHDNWAFLARFCFLSEYGEFEYYIEFDEEQGSPNLLLYYDTDDQWPAVYKTNKTCYEREAVLHIEQNQIINLTTKYSTYRDLGGCVTKNVVSTTTPSPKYTINVPTLHGRKTRTTTKKFETTTPMTIMSTTLNQRDFSDYSTSTNLKGLSINLTDILEDALDFESIYETNAANSTDYSDVTTREYLTSKAPIKKRSVGYEEKQRTNRIVICRNARRFQSSRERWWFVAVSNCNSGNKGINIKYKILMTNGQPGDYWHEHFSADQFYILPVLMLFTITYCLLILAIILCTIELKSRQLLHSTYKLFVMSVITQFFGIMLQCAAYLKFAANGVGAPLSKTFGSMFMGTSETCFLLLLLLLGKGYTITRGRLPISASVKLTIFMCLYSITYICIFIYEAKVFDPGEVLYLYESPAGYGLIVLRISAWLMFIYSTIFTLKHYPEKSNFYYPFNISGTMWFIAGPAFILSANTYIDKWVRESVVVAVLLFITFGGHVMFLVLTLPSMANKNFPYHVRTTQIGIMEVSGTVGSSTIEHFGHHLYEPNQNDDHQSQPVIIPLSRTTEELFGTIYTHQLQSNFTRTTRRSSGGENSGMNNAQNIAMQNVLSWSMAKNHSALEVPRLERCKENLMGLLTDLLSFFVSCLKKDAFLESPNSRADDSGTEEFSRSSSATVGNNDNVNKQKEQLHSNYEYVKDVPIELFTISKMVIKKKNDLS